MKGEIDGNCFESFSEIQMPITIGTIPIQDIASAPTMHLNGEVIINQPIGFALEASMANLNSELTPNMPDTSTAPSAPSPPFDIKSKFILHSFCLFHSNYCENSVSDPPSYEEAMLANENNNKYKPKYPMFRRQTSYSIQSNH